MLEVSVGQLALPARKSQSLRLVESLGHYAIDARKVERELGWLPKETFETGIRKTGQWYLGRPEWVRNVQSGAYREWIDMQYGAQT